MHTKLIRGALAATGVGLTMTALAVSPADAATVTQVRSSDLIGNSGVTGGATLDFLAEGVHLRTPDASAAARVHFNVGVPLKDVHMVDLVWYGTDNTPAVYYDVDIDGDGKPDGQLIGESYYGGTDVWLNRDAEDFGVTPTVPAGTFTALSPCGGTWGDTPQNGNHDGCTPPHGAGDPRHGTLDDWTRSLQAAGKNPVVVSGGFFANGLPTSGVVRSVTYGPNTYTFTSTAKTRVNVTANAKRPHVTKGNSVVIKGTATPAGAGAKVTLELKGKNGTWKAVSTQDLAASGAYELRAKAAKAGNAKYRVSVSETNTTAAATSNKVKVLVVTK
jgi:hypothetical protein